MKSESSESSLQHDLVHLRLGGRPLGAEAEDGACIQDDLPDQSKNKLGKLLFFAIWEELASH